MNFPDELLQKAKSATDAEEISALAKQHGVELTEKEAEEAFARLNKNGELADDELNNVAGGCGGIEDPKFEIGQRVRFYHGSRQVVGVIAERSYVSGYLNNCWIYNIKYENDDGMELNVSEKNISAA